MSGRREVDIDNSSKPKPQLTIVTKEQKVAAMDDEQVKKLQQLKIDTS